MDEPEDVLTKINEEIVPSPGDNSMSWWWHVQRLEDQKEFRGED